MRDSARAEGEAVAVAPVADRPSRAPAPTADPDAALTAESLYALQAVAGNAAVGRVLAEAPAEPEPGPDEGSVAVTGSGAVASGDAAAASASAAATEVAALALAPAVAPPPATALAVPPVETAAEAPAAALAPLTALGAAAAEPPPPAESSPALQTLPPAPPAPPPPPVPVAGTRRATFTVPGLGAPEARPELEAAAAQATTRVDAFLADRQATLAFLAARRPETDATLAAAETAAIAAVDETLAVRRTEVRTAVTAALALVSAQAAATRTEVLVAHLTAVGVIRTAATGTAAALRSQADAAIAQVGLAAIAQVRRLGTLYGDASSAITTAADDAGALAVQKGAARAATYRTGRINRSDGWLDGPLTDNRCEAQAEAAEKVGAGYRDELRKEGEKQVAALAARRPADEAAVEALAAESRSAIENAHGQALAALNEMTAESVRHAGQARATVLGHLDAAVEVAESGLRHHQAGALDGLTALAASQKEAVRRAAAGAGAAFAAAVDSAVSGVDSGLALLVDSLTGAGVPDVALLDATLGQAGARLDTDLAALEATLAEQAARARDGIAAAGGQATVVLGDTAQAAVDGAGEVATGSGTSLRLLATEAGAGLERLSAGHTEAATALGTAYAGTCRSAVDGVRAAYDELNRTFAEGGRRNAGNVRQALTAVVTQDMDAVVTTEAAKAYDQVQPRWKKVVKWVLIIAIVLVVAVVVGPMVIGAVTGAAAALGAGTAVAGAVGMIVGGAIVGAATSAATTLIDNALSGRELTAGLGTAIAIGALGGALGGAAASVLAGPIQGLSTIASRVGAQVGIDVVTDTVTNVIAAAATGDWSTFTWEAFATGVALSVVSNGVTAHPRVVAVQHRFSSAGYGHGYDTARGARLPAPPGPITIDTAHVNLGDTQAGGPYASGGPNSQPGSWNMGGGGHNANAIRARAARDGYTNTTVGSDPVTGVTVDRFGRHQLDNAGNFVPDPAAPGTFRVTERNKSLFPPSMGAPEIEAAANTALRDAMSGGPGTTHTPPSLHPNGTVKNGTFSALVTTPEGHPILVEGYYAPAPGGGFEIKTVYPQSNPQTGAIPVVPGSRIAVPAGVVTPPDYDAGD